VPRRVEVVQADEDRQTETERDQARIADDQHLGRHWNLLATDPQHKFFRVLWE